MSLQEINEKKSLVERKSFNVLAQYSPKDIELLKRQVAKNSTDDEFEYFLKIAKATNLNPFLKEIWFIKYKPKEKNPHPVPIIMTSRDGYLKIAKADPNFIGVSAYVVHENDEFELDPVEQKIKHKITFKKRGGIVGAYSILHRKDNDYKQIEIVNFMEYYKDTPIWNSNPSAMIKKVVQSRALKFFANISGLVTIEEMGINTNTIPLQIETSKSNAGLIEEKPKPKKNTKKTAKKKPKKMPSPTKTTPKEDKEKNLLAEELEQYKIDREKAREADIILKHSEWKEDYYDQGIPYEVPENDTESIVGEMKTIILEKGQLKPWNAKAEHRSTTEWGDGQFNGDVEPDTPYSVYRLQYAKKNGFETPSKEDLTYQ